MIGEQKCHIYLDTLNVAPYSLILNEEIWAKVTATNFYGDSLVSEAGNGALMKLIPDAPVNLANDATTTDASQIRFTW